MASSDISTVLFGRFASNSAASTPLSLNFETHNRPFFNSFGTYEPDRSSTGTVLTVPALWRRFAPEWRRCLGQWKIFARSPLWPEQSRCFNI